jgi:hypothetical protein
MSNWSAAGVLPCAVKNGKYYYLLGKESDGTIIQRNNLFCDFGGAKNKDEESTETALREYLEESLNVLGSEDIIKEKLCKTDPIINRNRYHLYLVDVDYDEEAVSVYNWLFSNFIVPKMVPMPYRGFTSNVLLNFSEKLRIEIENGWSTIKDRYSEKGLFAYNRIIKELIRHNDEGQCCFAEKVELGWFTEEEILGDKKSLMRDIFHETYLMNIIKKVE